MPIAIDHPPPPPFARPAMPSADSDRLRAARALETAFLAEMLRAAGTATPRDSFGGGIGEDQFASFLAEAQAKALMRQGGLGLAEGIVRAMSRADRATAP